MRWFSFVRNHRICAEWLHVSHPCLQGALLTAPADVRVLDLDSWHSWLAPCCCLLTAGLSPLCMCLSVCKSELSVKVFDLLIINGVV